MGVGTEKRAEFTVRGSSRRIECAQVQRESLVETPLESNGPAEKPCLRRLRAVGKQRRHTKDSEHGGERLSHVPIMPSDQVAREVAASNHQPRQKTMAVGQRIELLLVVARPPACLLWGSVMES